MYNLNIVKLRLSITSNKGPPGIIDFPMFVNVIGGKMTFPHLLTYLLLFLYVIELPFLEWDHLHLCAKLQGIRTL